MLKEESLAKKKKKKCFQACTLMGCKQQIWENVIEILEFDFSENTHKS